MALATTSWQKVSLRWSRSLARCAVYASIFRTEPKTSKTVAAQFLRNLINAVPYTLHKVLTDNGIQFTNRACDRYAPDHLFGRVCLENGIEHRLTKIKHPWTNG